MRVVVAAVALICFPVMLVNLQRMIEQVMAVLAVAGEAVKLLVITEPVPVVLLTQLPVEMVEMQRPALQRQLEVQVVQIAAAGEVRLAIFNLLVVLVVQA
jgi:hypothetical protein